MGTCTSLKPYRNPACNGNSNRNSVVGFATPRWTDMGQFLISKDFCTAYCYFGNRQLDFANNQYLSSMAAIKMAGDSISKKKEEKEQNRQWVMPLYGNKNKHHGFSPTK